MPGRSRIRYWEIYVAAVLALIYGYSVFSDLSIPDTAFFGGDTWEYQSIAVNFAQGKGFRFGALLPFEAYHFDSANPEYYDRFMDIGAAGGEPSTFRTPGYPFVLATIYRIFGVSPRTAIRIQIGWLILISASLPLLGRRLFGRGGFAAGLIAGLIFHKLVPNVGGEILTEALIALSVFLVLVTWVIMNRNHRTTLPSAAFFGLTLATAVLVKGSLIFLPPLFVGYIALQVLRKGRYRLSVLTTTLLAFLLPVVAYSVYATHANDSFVLLSRQGRSVLLAGNNEIAVETGGWSPQWREDPNSFFSQQLARDPDRSAASLIACFYARDPTLLAKAIPRKLVAMFGTKTAVLIGIALLFAATAFATCLVRGQAPQRLIVLLSLVAVVGLVIGMSSPQLRALVVVFAFGPGLLLFTLACLNHCFRRRVSAFWTSPGWVAVIFVITNFVLVAIVVFGDPRFLASARFVLLLAASFLLIRLAEALGLPIDGALTLEEDGPT